ncbi:hypothetical protein VUR80DRAFT_3282 [Thermomyces stellatus]
MAGLPDRYGICTQGGTLRLKPVDGTSGENVIRADLKRKSICNDWPYPGLVRSLAPGAFPTLHQITASPRLAPQYETFAICQRRREAMGTWTASAAGMLITCTAPPIAWRAVSPSPPTSRAQHSLSRGLGVYARLRPALPEKDRGVAASQP